MTRDAVAMTQCAGAVFGEGFVTVQQGSSYFPRWTLKRDGVIAPDERLPAGQTIALGMQHVVAMFGATVLAPLLMGFDPNVAILFSGIGTLIFFALVGGRVPSYLGLELLVHRGGDRGDRLRGQRAEREHRRSRSAASSPRARCTR